MLLYTSKDACVTMSASKDACVTMSASWVLVLLFLQAGMLVLLCLQAGMLVLLCLQAGMLGLLCLQAGMLGLLCLQAGMLGLLCGCVRDAEGGETTPSFGHPSNVRRAPEAALPLGMSVAKCPNRPCRTSRTKRSVVGRVRRGHAQIIFKPLCYLVVYPYSAIGAISQSNLNGL